MNRERLGTPLYALLLTILWDYCTGPVQLSRVPLVSSLCQSATPPGSCSCCHSNVVYGAEDTGISMHISVTVTVTASTAAPFTISVIKFFTTRVPGTVISSDLQQLLQPYY